MEQKQPTAQELIDHCNMGNFEFVKWYNFRLKVLNVKEEGVMLL